MAIKIIINKDGVKLFKSKHFGVLSLSFTLPDDIELVDLCECKKFFSNYKSECEKESIRKLLLKIV